MIATIWATMTTVGQRYPSQKLIMGAGLALVGAQECLGTGGHCLGRAADRIRHVEIVDGQLEWRGVDLAIVAERDPIRALDDADATKDRVDLAHPRPHLVEVVVGQPMPEDVGQRTQDAPILARIARRKDSPTGALNAAFGVDVGRVLFRVGSARQHDVGAFGAGIAVMALVDYESSAKTGHVDLIGTEQIEDLDRAARRSIDDASDVQILHHHFHRPHQWRPS